MNGPLVPTPPAAPSPPLPLVAKGPAPPPSLTLNEIELGETSKDLGEAADLSEESSTAGPLTPRVRGRLFGSMSGAKQSRAMDRERNVSVTPFNAASTPFGLPQLAALPGKVFFS